MSDRDDFDDIEENDKPAVNRKPLVYQLKHPIMWDNGKGKEEITELTFKRPKGKHIKLLPSEPKVSDLLMMASKLSATSHKFFDELESEDAFEVATFVGELL